MTVKEILSSSEDIFEFRIIPSRQVVFSDAVRDACKRNACGMYGKLWTCPPGVGEISQNEAKYKAFSSAAVVTFKYFLEDSFDFEGMIRGQKSAKAAFSAIRQKLIKEKISHLPLGCEGCGICESCTYPHAPCRFPDKTIPSVEAVGIDVTKLAKTADVKYNNGENTVTYFCVIFFG